MNFTKINIGETTQKPDDVTMKSRAIIRNEEGKILIANYAGVYLLPGGSIDEGENPNDAIIRELREETGLEIKGLEAFAKMKYFQNNYPTREGDTINRLLITYYYSGNEQNAIKHKRELTEKEIKGGFELKYYHIDEIERLLQENKTENPRNEYFNEELRTIIECYKKEKIREDIER